MSSILAANTMIMPVSAAETAQEPVITETAETENAADENPGSDDDSVMNENEETEIWEETDQESLRDVEESSDEGTNVEDSAPDAEITVDENDEDDTEGTEDVQTTEETEPAADASSEEPAVDASYEEPEDAPEENVEGEEEEQTEVSVEPAVINEVDETITEEDSQEASLSGTVSHTSVSVNGGWATKQITSVGDCLYFDIFIPSDGLVQITTQAFRSKTSFRLYNDDMSAVYANYGEEKGGETSPATRTISNWLKGGTYHLQVQNSYSQEYWFGGVGDVRVKAVFTPAGNTEAEPNNAFGQAESLASGRIIKGVILDIDDRCDFYKMTVQPGVNTILRITSYGENMSWAVYDSSFNQIMCERVPNGTDAAPKVVEYILEKPSGSLYYIRICDYYAPGSTWQTTFPARGAYSLQWTQNCSHTYGEAKIEKPASSTDGLLSYTCSKCKTEKYETIPCIKSVTLTKTSYVYNGKDRTPGVIAKDRTGKIIDPKYFSVSYSYFRSSVGKHDVKVTFKNRYTGGITLNYTVKPAPQKIKGASAKNFKKRSVKKNGASFRIKASAKTSLSFKSKSKYIKVNDYGWVTISKKIPRGTYTIVIKAKKDYRYRSAQKKFTIRIK